ncbi:hypothetical protein [Devosia sp. Naph2]|uniref:hypothetical protein n=1 Tax=Devosia polycyclovorans TaxID=3345148 RepID=UPI0035D04133
MLAVLLFYGIAFMTGLEAWLGWDGWLAILAYVVATVVLGPLGTLLTALIGGYGALSVWHWPWYFVILAFFPGIPLMAGGLMMSLLGAAFSRR